MTEVDLVVLVVVIVLAASVLVYCEQMREQVWSAASVSVNQPIDELVNYSVCLFVSWLLNVPATG